MDRLVPSDAARDRIAPLIIGRPDRKGSTGRNNPMFVEGARWIARTGSPRRALPEMFGRRSRKGVWRRIPEALCDDPDLEDLIVDPTVVRPRRHAAEAKKGGLRIMPLAAGRAPGSAWPSASRAVARACDAPPVMEATRPGPVAWPRGLAPRW